jgi:hypothetical protein
MAKSSVEHFDLKTIREMLTAAERKVFDSSLGKQIAAASREQIQAAIGQARSLRDKWRDLYAEQTRGTKRSAKAGTAANDRSREKSELFAGALVRLEARLAEVGTAVQAAAKQAGDPRGQREAVRVRAGRGSRGRRRGVRPTASVAMDRVTPRLPPGASGAGRAATSVAGPAAPVQ